MTDKHINTCEFLNICQTDCNGTLEDTEVCHCYELYKQLKHKDQELQEAMDNYVQLDLQRVKEYNELVDLYKAKEQECEELNAENISLRDRVSKLERAILRRNEQLDQLKVENEALKKTIMYKCPQCGEEYLSPIGASLYEENNKLKQILTEIKEIAKHCIKQDICTTCDYSDKCHIEDEEIPTYDVCKLILQKIREVNNES